MMYKYLPKTIDEFDIDPSLLCHHTNMLLIGGEQTGKTTLATILVNHYGQDQDHVLYINNLKEQGIQYFRVDVKNFCQTTIKHKVIVIDELDELSDQIQQIFLNYIDKYGHTVKFIATCKNKQKIIETMYSKFIIVLLKPIQLDYINKKINHIVQEEKIDIEPDAIQTIISLSNHKMNTILNYLERYKILNIPITKEYIIKTHTSHYHDLFETFTKHVFLKKNNECVQCINQLYVDGYSVMDILDMYYQYIKCSTVQEPYKYELIKSICKYIIFYNTIHEHQIELIFFVNDCINKISNCSHNYDTIHKSS
jgi:DNA polymerase III delta prime subunit